ncbi:MAG: energy-coupling factor ABC transporter permease, partial [Cyanobacteria bacterium P01_H01_bin.130]
MHVADGLLPAPLCIGGYALGGLTLWWTLRQSRREGRSQWRQSAPEIQPLETAPMMPDPLPLDHHRNIARAALLTAAFFVASSVRIAIPPTSVHFLLVGLMGALLGSLAFPAVVVGLILQAILVG